MTPGGPWEPAGPGLERRLLALGERLMAVEVRFSAGAEGLGHEHPHEQLTVCLEGRVRFELAGVTRELGPGETIVVPGGARHGALALAPSRLLDVFTPPREDLLASGAR